MKRLMIVFACAALLAGCATDYEAEIGSTGAGTEVTTGTATEVPSATAVDQLPTTEQDFVRETAQSGHAEVQLGKLISDKAHNSGLKPFAQRLVDDHTKANEE